jgi:phosphohistidine phosphatase
MTPAAGKGTTAMLELLLLRHAKSRWDQPGADDHERELNERGEAAAPRMGRLLRDLDLVPDLVLCSTAARARRTWELAAAELGGAEVPVQHLRTLYLAEPERMLDLVRHQDAAAARRLLLLGHNPGTHALAQRLTGAGEPSDRARLAEKFPTAALARIGFQGDDWRAAGFARGELLGYWRPRELG